ncbi:MAG: N-acetyltransferase, partial [Pseudomonadota bacterium]
MIEIIPETPDQHAAAIEALYDRTFGPGHFAKTAERLREGNASLPDVTRVAVSDGKVIGVCRVWPIFVGADRVPAVFI